jgi:hypothetical protein
MTWGRHTELLGTGEVCTEFWCGILRERDHLEGLGIEGRLILKLFFEKDAGDVDRIDLAHDRDKWRAVVNGEFLD